MPIHDWTRVDAGTFHHFHKRWISAICDALNNGLLPPDYYAMDEQYAAGFGSDVLALQTEEPDEPGADSPGPTGGAGLLVAPPRMAPTAETEPGYFQRKQSAVAVRHVSGDRVVAVVEIVSPGNKSSRHAFRSFLEKASDLLGRRIHLLILDLHPPGPRDPNGVHAAVWRDCIGRPVLDSPDKPLILVSYEASDALRAYVKAVDVGDVLPDMPLFLMPNGCVEVPLEATYATAFAAVPRRWRAVLEAPAAT
jgi:hypothetical protein